MSSWGLGSCAVKNMHCWNQPWSLEHATCLFFYHLVTQLCPALCDPMDCSPRGSSVNGISQARYWSGLPHPPPGDLPDSGMEPASLISPALADGFFTTWAAWEMQVKVLVAQSYLTLCEPMDCSLEGSSVHGFLQSRILEWVAIPFSRGSSQPRD